MVEGFNLCILMLISFQIFPSTSGVLNTSNELVSSSSRDSVVCSAINCGQGTCKASNASFLGFDCECNSGWRKPRIGFFTIPYCVLPNCTGEFQSGGGSPSRPPLPPSTVAPFLHAPVGSLNSCRVVWCGNGTCVADEAAAAFSYSCHCRQGFENLWNLTFLPCFRRGYFGEECNCGASTHRSSSASILQKIVVENLSFESLLPSKFQVEDSGSAHKVKCSWSFPSFAIQVIAVTILTCL